MKVNRNRLATAGVEGKPLISEGDEQYLGRIIVELWQQPGHPDAPFFAWITEGPGNQGVVINFDDWNQYVIQALETVISFHQRSPDDPPPLVP